MTNELVTRVIDGDTFDTSSSEPRIRLANVDAPELGSPGGQEAKWALARLIEDKRVRIQTVAHDIYGRRVANVWVGQQSVNRLMQNYVN